MTRNAEHTPSPQSVVVPKFGDIVENGWASEDNPTRRGFFVREFKRTGKMNPGRTWEITDGKGKFWEFKPSDIGERLAVSATPAPSSLAGGEKSLGQRAYERMRDHNDNAYRTMNSTIQWEELSEDERRRWDDDATENPRLYGLAALSPEAPALENPADPCAPENARDWPTIPARPVHIVRVSGATLDEQKAAVRQSETYQRGDTVLCWVNEGDLYANPSVVFEDLSALTPRHEAPASDSEAMQRSMQQILEHDEAPAEGAGEVIAWLESEAIRLEESAARRFDETQDVIAGKLANAACRKDGEIAARYRAALSALRARSSAPEAREGLKPQVRPMEDTLSAFNVMKDHFVGTSSRPVLHPAAPSADKLREAYGRWEREEVDSAIEVVEAVGAFLAALKAEGA